MKVVNQNNMYCEKCKSFDRKGYCNQLKMAVFENNYCCRFIKK